MSENPTHEEIKARLRAGSVLEPQTPGLREAARELFRPIIEAMNGREIIYRFRVPWLVRVELLAVDDEGFRAVASPIQESRDGFRSLQIEKPFEFGMGWVDLRLSGSAVCLGMVADHFFPDPAVVAEVKAEAARSAARSEISAILGRAAGEQ